MQSSDLKRPEKLEFPSAKGCEKTARRFEDFEELTGQVEAELAEYHFSAGFGKFREAVNLSRGFPALEETVVTLAAEQARQLLPRSWRIAESLLLEAAEVDSQRATPRELWDGIEQCEREETINSALNAADVASSNGMMPLARRRLAMLVAKYPGELRLETRLKAMEAQLALQLEDERLQRAEKKAKAAEAAQLLSRAAQARAREFEKEGFYAEALEQWEGLRKIDPLYPGLEEEIARCSQLNEGPAAEQGLVLVTRVAVKREQSPKPATSRWREIRLSEAAMGRLKTAATLIFTAATLAAAAGLVWIHSAKRVAQPGDAKTKTESTLEVSLAHPPVVPATAPVILPMPAEVTITKHPTVKVVEVKGAVSGAAPEGVVKKTPLEASPDTLPLPNVNQSRDILLPIEQPVREDWASAAAAQALADLDNKTNADNETWAAVNPSDSDSVESYLSRFPGGANRALAVRALADIRRAESARRQSAEVLAVVRQYAAAWSARNVNSILSLQNYLDRRTVKAQLSPLKSLAMDISPASEPQIEGERATVRCRRQVSEVFEDGVEKQSPEQTVTFVLAKHAGAWTIESAKQ